MIQKLGIVFSVAIVYNNIIGIKEELLKLIKESFTDTSS